MIKFKSTYLAMFLGIGVSLWSDVRPALAQRKVDTSTLNGKIIFGFQGWFACPNDGSPLNAWVHWFGSNRVSPETTTVDLLPDVSELPSDERCPTGWASRDGEPVALFSDQRGRTVLRQFEWLRAYGLDGVALQRFVVAIGDESHRTWYNKVLSNVLVAAEATGRGFFVHYDIAGAKPGVWADAIKEDWLSLLRDQHLASSPSYLHHKGKLVLGITGPGMLGNRPATPEETLKLLHDLREESRPWGGVTLLGTVPRGWRTRQEGVRPEPGWAAVFRAYDIVSPWLVGTYEKKEQIAAYVDRRLNADLAETKGLGMDYMPVVFPGFSAANLMHRSAQENVIPRRCGKFYWEQVTAFRAAGVRMLFAAMFDEVDEGTAMFKLVPHAAELPAVPEFVSLDADGCNLPSDWYLRVAAQSALLLRGEAALFPK